MTARVVIYSGGMDSFTLLHYVNRTKMKYGDVLQVLSFDYGQRHRKELTCAVQVCAAMGLPHRVIMLDALRGISGSALTDATIEVPEGHYEAESMKQTVVPGRNTIMLALALAHAETLLPKHGNAVVYYGAHAGDHHIYPDCRPNFIAAMAATMREASDHKVSLRAPFMHESKAGILRIGLQMGLTADDYKDTWTCYKGGEHACGVCGSCSERLEAFAKNGVTDPLPYAPATTVA